MTDWQSRLRQLGPSRPGKTEIRRIVELPRAPEITPEQAETLSHTFIRASAYEGKCGCDWCHERGNPHLRLLDDQSKGLHSFLLNGRGFYSVKVGGGKTAIAQLMASIAYQEGAEKILILLPPSVYDQFWNRDLIWAREHLAMSVPWYGLGKIPRNKRLLLAGSGRPGAYVLPYSCLSTEDTIQVLSDIDPDLVIADEAQNLRGDSAKTKRWWGFVNRREVHPKIVAMSGTLTSKSPQDYHKLIKACLQEGCPLPRGAMEAARWSELLKSGAEPPTLQDIEDMRPLLVWASVNGRNTKAMRTAYRLRLNTAPGVIVSSGKALGVGLEIRNTPKKVPSEIVRLMSRVQEDFETPEGEVLPHMIQIHETLRQLSAGFWTRHFWDEDHPRVEEAKDLFDLRQDYAKALREFFGATRYPRQGQDTPMAVGKWHHTYGAIQGHQDLYDLWAEIKATDDPELPERLSEPVWVSDYKIKAALAWARSRKREGSNQLGILWCHHQEVQRAVHQALKEAGLPVLWKGAGTRWLYGDGSERFFCVASISSHMEGKNLQQHRNQHLVQWPRPANHMEQLLGRLHRTGQQADRLVVQTNVSTEFDKLQVAATLCDTVYLAETLGGNPKLLLADWSPLPEQFSSEYLREHGYDPLG